MPSTRISRRTDFGAALHKDYGGGRSVGNPTRPDLTPTGRSRSEISNLRGAARVLTTCLLLLLGRSLDAAGKVDVIYLKSGDRLTCEIKRLDRSVLSISTDPLGQASVHWGEVVALVSPREFDVQLRSGEHYLGSPRASPPGRMILALVAGGTTSVALDDLVRMAPIGERLWTRFDGSVDAGFSFVQADLETHWTLNGAATYRGPQLPVHDEHRLASDDSRERRCHLAKQSGREYQSIDVRSLVHRGVGPVSAEP